MRVRERERERMRMIPIDMKIGLCPKMNYFDLLNESRHRKIFKPI